MGRFLMRRVSICTLAGLLFAVALPAAGLADELSEACQADAQQYWSSIQPGNWHLLKCLRQNKAQLSSPCQAALETAMQQMRVCRSDARQLCPGAQFGGAMVQCLEQHQSDLSPDCASHLASMPGAGQNGQPPEAEQPVQ